MSFAISAALLDACVLAALDRETMYGYLLTQTLQGVIDISESTLYPVLRRLQKDECLSTFDQPYQGRNRRYYAITDRGREQLRVYRGEWSAYKNRIDELLTGGEKP